MAQMFKMLVCELGGNWVGLLRRQLVHSRVNATVLKVEQRSDLEQELAREAAGCIAIQVDAEKPDDTLEWLHRVTRCYPDVFVLVIAPSFIPSWPFFEAGASFVVSHALQAPDAVRVIRRFIHQRPPMERTTDSIWSTLPWS
jgi:hypothetical protein